MESTYHVNSRRRFDRVNNDTFSRFSDSNERFRAPVLLGDQGGNIGLEPTSACACDYERQYKQPF